MNNQVSPESKEAAIKTLAIIGFIVAVVATLWLAVQIVRLVPGAFASLASLAESVYGTSQTLSVATQKSIVNSGETFVVSWTNMRIEGEYMFSYDCVEGVSVEVRGANGEVVDVTCEHEIALDGNEQSTEVIVTSEKRRFIDVPFTVSFIPKRDADDIQDVDTLMTVVNASIPQSAVLGNADSNEEPTTPVTPDTDSTPTPVVPQQPQTVTTTYFPVSNPNGFTDLRITYLGVGAFNENTKVFTPRTNIDNDMKSAVRFEVKNIGTKTSNTWTFDADLFGFEFTSDRQNALKPNERAVLTLSFDEITDETGREDVEVKLNITGDTNSKNNSFSQSVQIID